MNLHERCDLAISGPYSLDAGFFQSGSHEFSPLRRQVFLDKDGGTFEARFRVEDMQSKITDIADVIIDYGLMKYHSYAASSTLLDVENCTVHRYGVCYENIAEILRRHFDVTLPTKPSD